MKKYIVLILSFLFFLVSKAQLPSGFPTQYNAGWQKWGYQQSELGTIVASRDTNWTPRFCGTYVTWVQAGVDTSLWMWDCSKWQRVLKTRDYTNLQTLIGLKLNISDTNSMLSPYLRKVDTTNKWISIGRRLVDTLFRVNDSTVGYTINGTSYTFEIKGGASGGGGGSGNTNSNIGVGYRWAIPNTNNIKTFNPGFGTRLDSSTLANTLTIKADTTRSTGLPTYYYVDSSVAAGGGGSASANSYYVAQNGLGTGSGSTPATAVNMARLVTLSGSFVGGERIFFKANDTLRGQLTVKSNTYISRYDTGRAPIIAGTIRSSTLTWTQNGAIWSASYPTRVGRVLLNGIPQTTAQSDYYEVTGRPASNQVTASSATGLGSWVTDAEMISKEYNFRFKYNTITAYNSGAGTFTLNADNGISAGYSFKLFNHNELIDDDGEWAWVDGVVYYQSPGNVNPNTLNVELSVYDNGLVFENGGTNFTVNDVVFYAQAIQGINANKTNDIFIDNCNFYKQLDAGVFLDDSCANVNITNCALDSIGNSGILGGMEIKRFKFDNLLIKHIGTQVDPPFSRTDDIIARNGVNGFGVMLFPNADNGQITNCTVDSVAYIGLRADASNTLFQYNKVSNFSIRQNDAGGIYTWGNETSYLSIYGWRRTRNVTIANNVVWNGIGGNEGGPSQTSHAMGIYLDNGTNDTKVIGNTTYDNTGSGIYIGFDTKNNELSGNVSYGNDEAQVRISNNTADGGVVTNNIKIKDNILVALKSTSRCFLILNSDGGSYNPFDSGYCINNSLVTPYTNNIIQTESTDYTLATGRTFYGVNFGQQDVYSTAFVNDSIARVLVKIDINLSPESRWSIMPENFRASVNKYSNDVLAPGLANVWVTAVRDFVVNHNSGPTSMALSKDNVEKLLFGVANANNQLINGSVNDDAAIRTPGGKMLFSADNGTNAVFTITSDQVAIGTVSPSYKLDVQTNTNAFERINIKNSNSGSSAGGMLQVLNNSDFGFQAGIGSSNFSLGFIGNNDVFFQANTASGANFNIMSATMSPIRFGMYDGFSSVQEMARFNTSKELQIGSTSDQGAYTLQNTGGLYQSGVVTMNIGSDATGDIYYRNSGGNLTRLGVGSNGDVLTLSSGLPSWQAGSGATTIYNGNGSLSGDRTVTGSNNDLTFLTIDQYRINSNYFALSKNNASRIYTSYINAASADVLQFGYTPGSVGSFTQGTAYVIDTLNNIGLGGIVPTSTIPNYTSGGNVIIHGLQSTSDNYYKVTNITTSQTIGVDAYFMTVDATGGNITITLPAASTVFGANVGICYVFKRIDNSGNTVTIQRAGSDTIDGGTSFSLTTQWESKGLQCASTSTWLIVN